MAKVSFIKGGSKCDNCRNKWVMILEVFYHQQSAHNILSWGDLGE